jgi:uncharacterized Zn finger protein (UPF0148 family)
MKGIIMSAESVQDETPIGTCPTCGGGLMDSYVFCPYCGEFAKQTEGKRIEEASK